MLNVFAVVLIVGIIILLGYAIQGLYTWWQFMKLLKGILQDLNEFNQDGSEE